MSERKRCNNAPEIIGRTPEDVDLASRYRNAGEIYSYPPGDRNSSAEKSQPHRRRSTGNTLRKMLDGANQGFFVLDRDGHFTEVNQYALKWADTGRDLVGRSYLDLLDGNTRAPAAIEIRAVFDSGKPASVLVPSVLRPGRLLEMHFHPWGGSLVQFGKDVTDSEHAEIQTPQRDDLLQSTLDAFPDRIAILNAHGEILAVNAAWHGRDAMGDATTVPFGVGDNYLECSRLECCQMNADRSMAARVVVDALWMIYFAGEVEFRSEYACRRDGDTRSFEIRLSRFTVKGATRVIVVHTDVSEQRRSEQEHHRLSAQVLAVQDAERRRIARELHDSTAQLMLCASLAATRAKNSSRSEGARQRALAEALELLEKSQAEIRTLSYLLHPPMLDEVGLVMALRWYVTGFYKRTGIPVMVKADPSLDRLELPCEMRMALFRIAQEALSNILRHSGSSTASIRLQTVHEAGVPHVRLLVQDRGYGLSPERPIMGVGLMSMTERARMLHGTLELRPRHPTGAEVIATVPVLAEPSLRRS